VHAFWSLILYGFPALVTEESISVMWSADITNGQLMTITHKAMLAYNTQLNFIVPYLQRRELNCYNDCYTGHIR